MLYREFTFTGATQLNASLYERFKALSGTDRVRQSHHFAGRFENTYIESSDIPEMTTVLDLMKQQSGMYLGVPADSLKAGFWFNAMQAGQRTILHHHDENDELLSAVYYIRVPEDSGNLILHVEGSQVSIKPEEGKLVMFAPSVLHEVSEHHGSGLRLSVAMNVGPLDSEQH